MSERNLRAAGPLALRLGASPRGAVKHCRAFASGYRGGVRPPRGWPRAAQRNSLTRAKPATCCLRRREQESGVRHQRYGSAWLLDVRQRGHLRRFDELGRVMFCSGGSRSLLHLASLSLLTPGVLACPLPRVPAAAHARCRACPRAACRVPVPVFFAWWPRAAWPALSPFAVFVVVCPPPRVRITDGYLTHKHICSGWWWAAKSLSFLLSLAVYVARPPKPWRHPQSKTGTARDLNHVNAPPHPGENNLCLLPLGLETNRVS